MSNSPTWEQRSPWSQNVPLDAAVRGFHSCLLHVPALLFLLSAIYWPLLPLLTKHKTNTTSTIEPYFTRCGFFSRSYKSDHVNRKQNITEQDISRCITNVKTNLGRYWLIIPTSIFLAQVTSIKGLLFLGGFTEVGKEGLDILTLMKILSFPPFFHSFHLFLQGTHYFDNFTHIDQALHGSSYQTEKKVATIFLAT